VTTRKPLISGVVFNDVNSNGKQDATEKGLASFGVFRGSETTAASETPTNPRLLTDTPRADGRLEI